MMIGGNYENIKGLDSLAFFFLYIDVNKCIVWSSKTRFMRVLSMMLFLVFYNRVD
jgi:hypothetical protein